MYLKGNVTVALRWKLEIFRNLFFFFDGGGQAVFKGSIFGCNDDMDLEFNSCIL